MGRLQVIVSDLTTEAVPEAEYVPLTVHEYPGFDGKVKLDASKGEVDELRKLAHKYIILEAEGERFGVELADFMKFVKEDADEVIHGAERISTNSGRRQSNGTVKVDYTAPENFGVLHRGIVTDDEKRLVRDNLDQANANRKRHGQPEIKPNDPKEAARYGFEL